MTTRLPRVTLVATTLILTLGCGSTPAPEPKETGPKPAAQQKGTVSRADEIIADLKKWEAEQAELKKQAEARKQDGSIPVVVEVTPSAGTRRGSSIVADLSPASSPSQPGSAPADVNHWMREMSVAQSRLRDTQAKLETARIRLNNASAGLNDQNTVLNRIAREAHEKAQAEVSQLQSAVYSDQSAVDNVRYAAIRAGVPAEMLR
jgi:hypothetical protein